MPTEPRSAFLLVRRRADLEHDSAGLTAYLSDRRRRSHPSDSDALQGIWIDEDGVANVPDALVLPDADGGQRKVRVIEATGVNGIWMWCWLEPEAGSFSRIDLLEALLDCFGHDDATAARFARFIPVFAGDAPDAGVRAELQLLSARDPELVLPPIFQDSSGSLVLPSAPPHRAGAFT